MTVTAEPQAQIAEPPARRVAAVTPARAVLALVVVVGVALRAYVRSPLWLDESLTVNIASLPLGRIPSALRVDGAPPLYYVLLHGWMRLFGSGDVAVRALSSLFSVATLPLVYLLGRRYGGRLGAWAALALLSTSPFAVRYATECRMYSMVLFLVAAGWLLLQRAWDRPILTRLAPLPLASAALAYTHYWSLYLLVVVAGLLLWAVLRSATATRRIAGRCLLALAAGGVLFLPWLPTFLFQGRHTGTPWAAPAQYSAVVTGIDEWAGGTTNQGVLLWVLFLALAACGLLGRRLDDRRMEIDLRVDRAGALLAVASLGTLLVAVTLGLATGSAFTGRYTSVAILPFLLLVVRGLGNMPGRAVRPVLVLAVAAGLASSASAPLNRTRTDADVVAAAIRSQVKPGDVVVYCPDQLGPAVHRALGDGPRQVVYPTLGGPSRVDWVDYKQRNESSSPQQFVAGVRRMLAPGASTWLVLSYSYRTFGGKCEQVDSLLAQGHRRRVLVAEDGAYMEHPMLVRDDHERAAR